MFEQLQQPKTWQVHSGHARGNVAAKKNYARGTRRDYPPSSRYSNLVPRPRSP